MFLVLRVVLFLLELPLIGVDKPTRLNHGVAHTRVARAISVEVLPQRVFPAQGPLLASDSVTLLDVVDVRSLTIAFTAALAITTSPLVPAIIITGVVAAVVITASSLPDST